MSETHGMTQEEIRLSMRDALAASLKGDPDGLAQAMSPLHGEDACLWDSFTWTMGMVAVPLRGLASGPGHDFYAVPIITMHDTVTGEHREFHVDDAPDDCPKSLIVVTKLGACWVNQDRDGAMKLWDECIEEDDAKGEPTEEDHDSLLGEIMTIALQRATDHIRAVQAAQAHLFPPN